MLTEDAFRAWMDQLDFSLATRHLLTEMRQSDPVRRTEGRYRNMRGRYPSRKMQLTIQFESHTTELWAIYAMEVRTV